MTENGLISSTSIPVSPNDFIRAVFWNNNSGTSFTVFLRYSLLLKDGSIVDGNEQISVAAGASAQVNRFALTDGWLLSASISASGAPTQAGLVYCSLGIQQGAPNDPANVLTLISNYIAGFGPLQYPLGGTTAPNEIYGASIAEQIPNPGGGTEYNANLLFAGFVKIISVSVNFSSSAAVGDRIPSIKISDITGNVAHFGISSKIPASSNVQIYSMATPLPSNIVANVFYFQFTFLPFIQNPIIQTVTQNIQGGDSYDSMIVRYRAKTAL